MPDEPHDNSVADVDEVADRFQGVGVEGLALLFPLPHEGLPTYPRPRLRPIHRGSHDDVGVIKLTEGIHVSCVPCVEPGLHDLHVLLRHRPRSIQHAGMLGGKGHRGGSRRGLRLLADMALRPPFPAPSTRSRLRLLPDLVLPTRCPLRMGLPATRQHRQVRSNRLGRTRSYRAGGGRRGARGVDSASRWQATVFTRVRRSG
jgi:hypothetical protein